MWSIFGDMREKNLLSRKKHKKLLTTGTLRTLDKKISQGHEQNKGIQKGVSQLPNLLQTEGKENK